MGGIILVSDGDNEEREMTFTASSPEGGSCVRVVVDGVTVITERTEGGEYSLTFRVKPERTVSLARVEMYNPEGRCILLTNPIYLVRTAEFFGEIPKDRIYGDK